MSESVVHRISGWRRFALWPLSLLLKGWSATIRISLPPEDEQLLRDTSVPSVIVFWHNRLFMVANVYRRFRRSRHLCGLVSPSRDGAWLAAFLSLMGVASVRGSSSGRTIGATRELVDKLSAGYDIAITPDGPLGPRYEFKEGAVCVARRAGAPILLVSGWVDSAWCLRSWDGFVLPRPFAVAHLRARIVHDSASLRHDDDRSAAAKLRTQLLKLGNDFDRSTSQNTR